jgi:hypothetical protein
MAKSNSELLERAYGIAEMHFYSDDECECPWEPYEHMEPEELQEHVHDLAQTILLSLQWAHNEN